MKKQSKLYQYLEQTGALERGVDAEIQALKAEYWRQYKKTWKATKLSTLKQFTVALDAKELGIISGAAKKHSFSCTKFIKEAALAFCRKKYLVLSAASILKIEELLTHNYMAIEGVLDSIESDEDVYESLLSKIDKLEREIVAAIMQPKEIETCE